MDQKRNKNDRHQVGLPVYRKAVRTVTSRSCTRKSVGGTGCIVGVEWRSENRGRRVDGQDGGGSKNVTDRVCSVALCGANERSEDAIVDRRKKVDQKRDEDGEDDVEMHDGRREEDAEVESARKSGFIYPGNTGGSLRRHSENSKAGGAVSRAESS